MLRSPRAESTPSLRTHASSEEQALVPLIKICSKQRERTPRTASSSRSGLQVEGAYGLGSLYLLLIARGRGLIITCGNGFSFKEETMSDSANQPKKCCVCKGARSCMLTLYCGFSDEWICRECASHVKAVLEYQRELEGTERGE